MRYLLFNEGYAATAGADLMRGLGRAHEAATSYREALALAPTDAEHRYLARRVAEVSGQ